MTVRRWLLPCLVFAIAWACAARTARADDTPPDEDDAAASEEAGPTSPEVEHEFDSAFQGVSHDVSEDSAAPAITAEQLRTAIRAAKAKVLPKLEAKIEIKSARRMATISKLIFGFSLAGVLLLGMPLFLRRRYPGQGAKLFKYSALAAVTFVVTVNLFGVIALGFRSAQAALARQTNPQLKIAEGFFDGLDDNADEMASMGGQLIGPTLYQLQASDEQPTVLLLENGQKLIGDARVFVSIAHLFKKLDFIFALLPIVLLLLTLALFVRSIWPTLLEIIRLPAAAASGSASGRDVIRRALRRVLAEVLVTLCTVGVLFAITILASAILGYVVKPALYSILEFFGTAIVYLQVVPDASSGLIFDSLFGVILFLGLNLVAIIVAMSMYLGKAQRVFQRRFHDHQPLRAHARFWKWGTISVLVAQLVPLVYMVFAAWALDKIENHLIGGADDPTKIPWAAVMLVGPLFLVVGFALVMWASRALRAIRFLATYKVPPVPAPARIEPPPSL